MDILLADKVAENKNTKRDKRNDDTTAQANLRKTVSSLLTRGQISRAVPRTCSHGIAKLDKPEIQAALQAKYTKHVLLRGSVWRVWS